MNDWAELDRALAAIVASGCAEVREDGEWLAEFADLHCEVHCQGKAPLVHLWSEQRNLTRRIMRVQEQSGDRIVLEVQRFGRAKPGRLEVLRADARRTTGRITREQFRARFGRMLAEQFPDAIIDSLAASPDLEHSFSGVHVRGSMHEGTCAWAVLAISSSESATAIEGALSVGVLWLDWMRGRAKRRVVEGLRIFVPAGGTSRSLRERVCALAPDTGAEIFEFSEAEGTMQKADPADAGNLQSFLVPRREAESALRAATDAARHWPALARELRKRGGAIRTRVLPGATEVAFSFRGLDVVRWRKDGLWFGLGDSQGRLTEGSEPALEQLLDRLERYRNPLAGETCHSLYRAAPERWLEMLVLEDPTKLDAQLDPEHMYSQVPALVASERGVLDLLGVTRRGRLVVIELKASEDIQMSLQAADYWLRVRRHQRDGEFERYGYFANVALDPRPPLLWLAAPGLRFHSTTETLLRYLSTEIQVTRIGLNENWRRGIRVIFRQ
jgi:hypothetical protein